MFTSGKHKPIWSDLIRFNKSQVKDSIWKSRRILQAL